MKRSLVLAALALLPTMSLARVELTPHVGFRLGERERLDPETWERLRKLMPPPANEA